MDDPLLQRLRTYQLALIASVLFAFIGFSYNVWRMEASETNNNTRTACFELLLAVAELEQLIYAAHYDGDQTEGNPRRGWVKVGLIVDLSVLTDAEVEDAALALRDAWGANWHKLPSDRAAADALVAHIDEVRGRIKTVLRELD